MSLTNAEFFERYADTFEDSHWEDDDLRTDVMALIVLDDVPVEVRQMYFPFRYHVIKD